MSFQMQLAVQGGGAKICALLAVLEAIQKFESEKRLKVTRVAGTSAGSIIASFLAAGVEAASIRRRLLMPGVNERLARLFPRPGLRRALLLLLRGSPFWKERPLRDILRQEFRAVGLQDMTLGALKKKHGCQVKIVAADLTNARPVVFESDSDSLLDAILHSCGVPFYFRLGGKEQVLVDGGIVENFPVEILTRDAALYGPVLGIAFTEPDRNPPESLGQFTSALLETAMNHSMLQARQDLEPDSLFEVHTDVGTFDVEKALNIGLGDKYNSINVEASQFLDKFCKRPRHRATLSTQLTDIQGKLGKIYDVQHSKIPFVYKFASMEVQANTLCDQNEPDEMHHHGTPDIITYRLVFQPGSQPIHCLRVALAPSPGVPRATSEASLDWADGRLWSLSDSQSREIDIIAVPALDERRPDVRQVIFWFDPPLEPQGQLTPPFTLVFRDRGVGLTEPLLSTGQDVWAYQAQRVEGVVGRAELVFHVPKSVPSVRLVQTKGDKIADGREMVKPDLQKNYPAQPGFDTFGWCANNIPPELALSVDLMVTLRRG